MRYFLYLVLFLNSAFAALPLWNDSTPMMTFKSSKPIVIGVSGHASALSDPVGNDSGISLANQISAMQELQVMVYRTDYRATWEEGGAEDTGMLAICQTLDAAGIKILLAVGSLSNKTTFFASYNTSPESLQLLYEFGYTLGAYVATRYDTYTYNHTYELSNELDLYNLSAAVNWKKGDVPADWDVDKSLLVYWYLRGLDEGIKSVVPAAQTMINSCYYGHAGFHRFLNNPSWLNASFSLLSPLQHNITAWHPYFSDTGGTAYNCNPLIELSSGHDVLAILNSFGKPIAFSEIGKEAGSAEGTEPEQADKCGRWVMDLFFNGKTNISWIVDYCLVDDVSAPSYYGLLDSNGDKKLAFYSVKSRNAWLKSTHTNP